MAWDSAYNDVVSDMFHEGPVEASKLPFYGNTKWEDTATNSNEVTIVIVGDATIGDYDGSDITFGSGDASNAVLSCDQAKYFADLLDDRVQLVGQYAVVYGQKALKKLALESDKYVLALAGTEFTTNVIDNGAGAALDVNGANMLDVIDQVNLLLNEQEVPDENRFLALPPALYDKALKAGRASMVASDDALFTGKAQKLSGINLISTNQYTAEAGGDYKCLFGHPDAIAVANKQPTIESGRAEKKFADFIKSLMRFGAKVVDEKQGGLAWLKAVAEA